MSKKREKRYYQPFTIKNVRNSGKEAHFSQMITLFTWKKGAELPFVILRPNLTEMYLNIASRHHRKARLLWNRKISANIKRVSCKQLQDIYGLRDTVPGGDVHRLQLENSESTMYDFLEHLIVAIVFSYSGLEAFANRLIPDNYSVSGKTKDRIEKSTELTEKLKCIIPTYYNIESPTQQPFWQRLIELEKVRHDIIHCKSGIDYHGKIEIKLLERIALGGINKKLLDAARECIQFFVKKLKNNPKYVDHHELPLSYRFKLNVVSNFREIVE